MTVERVGVSSIGTSGISLHRGACQKEHAPFLEISETSALHHVIGPGRTPRRTVRRDVDAGEGAKLIRKVRLVVIPAVEGQLRPGHLGAAVERAHRVLEALDAAPHLRREADLFAKKLRK